MDNPDTGACFDAGMRGGGSVNPDLLAALDAYFKWRDETAFTFQTKGEVEDNAWSIIDAPTYLAFEQHEDAVRAAFERAKP